MTSRLQGVGVMSGTSGGSITHSNVTNFDANEQPAAAADATAQQLSDDVIHGRKDALLSSTSCDSIHPTSNFSLGSLHSICSNYGDSVRLANILDQSSLFLND